MATWVSRIPAIKDKLGLNDGQLGLALFGIAIGALSSFPLAGFSVARFGSRVVTVGAGFCLAVALVLLCAASSLWELALALIFLGGSSGAMDVAMNAQGVEVEQRLERPIMGSLHGTFSLGGLSGAAFGGFLAGRGVVPLVHFGVVGAVAALLVALSAARLLAPVRSARKETAPPVFALPDRALLGFGAITFCAFLTEGAMADWSALYLRDTLGTNAAFAAIGFAAFSLSMTLARFGGDALVARLGAARIVAGGGLLSAFGLAMALLWAQPVPALVGFACVGAGMASVAPLVFSAAGRASGSLRARGSRRLRRWVTPVFWRGQRPSDFWRTAPRFAWPWAWWFFRVWLSPCWATAFFDQRKAIRETVHERKDKHAAVASLKRNSIGRKRIFVQSLGGNGACW